MGLRGEFEDMDDFLDDARKARGSFGSVKWRKKKPPIIDTVMSMKRKPIALFRHSLPMNVSYEKEGVQESHVYSDRQGCWENPDVIDEQNFRYREKDREVQSGSREVGERKNPPLVCPQCMFFEWVRQQVLAGKLGAGFGQMTAKMKKGNQVVEETIDVNFSFVEPLFHFSADDDDDDTIIHAGGFANLFKEKQLGDETKILLRSKKIQLTDAWRENGQTQKNYLFCICDYDDPSKGLQKAIEAGQLGEAVIKVIAAERESLGAEKGNPFKNPYVIRWKHLPNAVFPEVKYEALKMAEKEIGDDVRQVIAGEPPDVTDELLYLNAEEWFTRMEEHCLLKGKDAPPWGEFLKGAKAPGPTARSDSAKAPAPRESEKGGEKPRGRGEQKPAPKDPKNPLGLDASSDDTVACECPVSKGSEELCGGYMRTTDSDCPVCGAVYDLKTNAIKTRSWDKNQAKVAPAAPRGRSASGGTSGSGKKPEPKSSDGDEDEIPFARCEFGSSERWTK